MRVAAVNDLSGFGKCSLVADLSVMSAMGIEVCPVPTAVLSAQTGFSHYHIHDIEDMVANCRNDYISMGAEFDGILTGYIPNVKVADDVLSFVSSFSHNGAVLLVDPVMADGGRCYSNYSKEMHEKIAKLSSMADIITPNLTELCLLAGYDAEFAKSGINKKEAINEIIAIADKAKAHDGQSIVVTGISVGENSICNLVVSPGEMEVIECSFNGQSYSGTGDLLAASLLGGVLKGKRIVDAAKLATEFISSAIAETSEKDRNYGIDFEKSLYKLKGGKKV